MLFVRAGQAAVLIATLALSTAFASRIHRAPTAGHQRTTSTKKIRRTQSRQSHGQKTIDSTRASEIQQALIRHNYLAGNPSGQWDNETQAAMQKYQADHGWQTKLMPDSRALISLGLGPSQSAGVPQATRPVANVAEAQEADRAPEANTLASVHSISQ
jgi:peptidoglycan hydrolase-like protein with peptidoglycan-binding domain